MNTWCIGVVQLLNSEPFAFGAQRECRGALGTPTHTILNCSKRLSLAKKHIVLGLCVVRFNCPCVFLCTLKNLGFFF